MLACQLLALSHTPIRILLFDRASAFAGGTAT
jgi:hypothetical protein